MLPLQKKKGVLVLRKKLVALCIVTVIAALLIMGYYTFLAPKAQQGIKEVTVEVQIDRENIAQSFSYRTDREYVAGLLTEHQDDLKVETESGSFGPFITGMMGIQADSAKEFYSVKVDGADASVGIASLLVEDGRTYSFVLTGFTP